MILALFFVCVGIGMLQKSNWECSSSGTDDGCGGVCFSVNPTDFPLCVLAESETR